MKEIDKWMDVGTLKATIDTWNQVCENGEDPEFHRSPATLNPLNNPPFYAYTVYPGSCSTLGGAMKNEHGQVLDRVRRTTIPPFGTRRQLRQHVHSHTYGINRRQPWAEEHDLGTHIRPSRGVARRVGREEVRRSA